ncbi:MAG: biopolymer transporter ExbD, partial [Verrucomicrobia bacterium]|nr:biopolymer transporter ExbD [Verrucomicrobiota bacterium]
MRRFSQKNSLVTLSEINIVPLMDLTFVLLIIFVITTPLLEQSMKLDLPSGGEVDPEPLRPDDVATIEIDPAGNMRLDKKPLDLSQITAALKNMHTQKKDL